MARAPRRVVMLGYPGVQALDVTGPMEVFAVANRLAADPPRRGATRASRPPYAIELVAPRGGPFATSGGYALVAQRSLREVRGDIDTLIVAGGSGVRQLVRDRTVVGWVRRRAGAARRVCSVCTGAFVLGAAGLLEGRRATTHWSACDELAAAFPSARVERDPIFVRDGSLYTSAGITAGMDMALALVEADLGRRAALRVARWLVLFLKRPGGQCQFSTQLSLQWAATAPVRDAQEWISDHLDADLAVERLARRAGMSPRNFARVFAREVGTTPARFVAAARIEAARQQLEAGLESVEEVAARCGFGTAETLRRSFLRTLQVTPSQYRARFRSSRDGTARTVEAR